MHARLKPLADQVIVITGATSGHGLCTAQQAAAAGAKVMLAARDEMALRDACQVIRDEGGTADYVITDVGDQDAVAQLAERTIERFGGFDTWVNNAGIGVYAEILDLPLEHHHQVFKTNYWGVVHGSTAALRHLKDQRGGGAIINVGSINSDMSGPLLSSYNASKHAVKGFTDAMRIEARVHDWPVSITLIKPSAIGTPFPKHGRNLTGFKARLPRPIYKPDLVAGAILDAAQRPRRAITVGGAGKFQVLGATLLPWLFDRVAATMSDTLVDREHPVGKIDGNLYAPQGDDGDVEGDQRGRSLSSFTTVRRHSRTVTAVGIVAAIAAGYLISRKRGKVRHA